MWAIDSLSRGVDRDEIFIHLEPACVLALHLRASKSHEMMRLLGLLALFAGSALGSSGFAETPSATVDLRITNAD